MTVVEEIIEETRAALPEAPPDIWTLGDMVRLGATGVTQQFGSFGYGRNACAQSAAGLGYRALFFG